MEEEKKCVFCNGKMEYSGTYNRGSEGLFDFFQLRPDSERGAGGIHILT